MRSLYHKVLAFMARDFKTALSYPMAFILGLGGILFNVLIWYFFSRAFKPDYFPFVIVGIALQNYMSVAMGGLTRSIRESQMLGTLEMLLSTPTSLPVVIFASSVGPFLVTTLRIAAFFLFASLMGESFDFGAPLAILSVLVLSIVSFSSVGILSAGIILVIKRGDPFTLLVAAMSSLLSGVFYPVTVLPPLLQTVGWFVPVTHSVEALRQLVIHGKGFGEIADQLIWLAGFSVVALPLAVLVFVWGVGKAKREGTLGQF